MPTKTNPLHRSIFYKFAAAVGLSIVASLGLLSFVFAEPIHTRLNPDLVEGGVIKSYTISPDGNLVAYIADQETKGTDELYIVPIDGGTPEKLNSTLVVGGSVIQFLFTPDSKNIIYVADVITDNQFSFYSISSSGGSSVEIVRPQQTEQTAIFYANRQPISQDSKWLVYPLEKRESGNPPNEFALMATPIDQRNPITLSAPLVQGGSIQYFKISPDGKTVVYRADQQVVGIAELYSVPIQGGAVTQLSVPLQTGDQITDFYFSPDGTRIIYSASVGGKSKLYRVALVDTVSTEIAQFTGHLNFNGKFSPDGKKLLYSTSSSFTSSGVHNLYIAPVNDGSPLLLSTSVDVQESNAIIGYYGFTPDGNNVVVGYNAGTNGTTKTAYVVPSGGGTQKKIFSLAENFENYYFQISQDSNYVVHSVFNYSSQSGKLYSTDLNTSTTITLTINDYDGPPFYLSPDGNGVFFRSKTTQNVPAKIMRVPFTSTSPLTISVDTSFDVGYSQSIPAPLLHGEQVCQIYTLQNLSKDFYSSCVPSSLPQKKYVYLPVVAR